MAAGDASTTPPIILGSSVVPYPQGAEGEAVVLLEIVVAVDGSVSEVNAVEGTAAEGTEPFTAQAIATARAWRFTPARQGDVPKAARIRVRVEFRPPTDAPATSEPPPALPSSPPPPQLAETPAAAATGAPAAPQLPTATEPVSVDVTVTGERRELGQTTMSSADVRNMPGAFGDPFRAVEALPGVTPAMSGVPYYFVRGAPPNTNGYFVDGIRVPLLFHLGLGPSVVHPALIERIDFYPSAAPAAFGGYAGGIIAGSTRAPAIEPHLEANLRLVDAGALAETPFAGGRGNVLLAGRYGYPGPVLSAFSEVRLQYWDYQAQVSWALDKEQSLRLFGFGSHDYLGHEEIDGTQTEDFVSDFHRLDLQYEHSWHDGQLQVGATLGVDSQGATPTYLTDHLAHVRVRAEQRVHPDLQLRFGTDAELDVYSVRHTEFADPRRPEVPSSVEPAPTNSTLGVHTDAVWQVTPRVQIVPGGRLGLLSTERANSRTDSTRARATIVAAEPRLATRVTLTPSVAWLTTAGIAHQYPTLRIGSVPAILASGSGLTPGRAKLQRAIAFSQGVEWRLPADFVLTTTGFLTFSSGLTDLTQDCQQIEPPSIPAGQGPRPEFNQVLCPSDKPVKGHAYGAEILLRRSLAERVSGWLSYTLSRSVRQTRFLTLDGGESLVTVPSDFDRTHVLNAVLAFDLGRCWRAGARGVFYSGVPYSDLAGSVPVPPYNVHRDPPFVRLDVRLEKRWAIGDRGSMAFVVEGQNVTLSKEANTLGMDCRGTLIEERYTTECQRGTVGPITLPSVGVEAFF